MSDSRLLPGMINPLAFLEVDQPCAETAAASRAPSPEAYTPKHLAEKILTSKAALEGERAARMTIPTALR